ncbi:hypothetical protein C9374_009143 [Naegleria lovaniensis]|uniref:Inosine/uridine-preferring nucleoside hydrolase domain-containing protein n=1 Tax=Naegleria lovaniensis TaxID=51637 RepID=A0AA88GHT4_NAELO|nr:uncharacterized protein C9374_009143 [Naegleria lovaniensis]KAG2377627.1 hypothetical protein C9374_009143 [Naegleria lovaniensis]
MKQHTQQLVLLAIGLSSIFILSIVGILYNLNEVSIYKLENTSPWIIHTDISVNHFISMALCIRQSKIGSIKSVVTTSSDLQNLNGDTGEELTFLKKLQDSTFEKTVYNISDIWKMYFNKRREYRPSRSNGLLNRTMLMKGIEFQNSQQQEFSKREALSTKRNLLHDFVENVLKNRTGRFDVNITFLNSDVVVEETVNIFENISMNNNNNNEGNNQLPISFLILGPLTTLSRTLNEMTKTPDLFQHVKKIVIYGGTINSTLGEYNLGVDSVARKNVFDMSRNYLNGKIYLFPKDAVEKTPLTDPKLLRFSILFKDACERKLMNKIKEDPTFEIPFLYEVIHWWLNTFNETRSQLTNEYLAEEMIFNHEVVVSSVLWMDDQVTTFNERHVEFDETVPGLFKILQQPSRKSYSVKMIQKVDWYKYFGLLLHRCAYF